MIPFNLKLFNIFIFKKNKTTEETKFIHRNSINIWGITSSFEDTEKHGYRDQGTASFSIFLGFVKADL